MINYYRIENLDNIPSISISVIMTSTLVTMETIPAALVPTHVYTPVLASVVLSILLETETCC